MATSFADKKNQYASFSVSADGFKKLSESIASPKKPTEKLVALMKGHNSSLKK